MAKLEEVTQELVVYNVRISRSLPYAGRLFGNDLEFTGGSREFTYYLKGEVHLPMTQTCTYLPTDTVAVSYNATQSKRFATTE